MNETVIQPRFRARRAESGQSFPEVVVIIFVVTLVMGWAWNMNERFNYLHRHVFPKQGIVFDATRDLTSELNAVAQTDPTNLYNQIQPNQQIVISVPTIAPSPGHTAPPEAQNRSLTFTLESKAQTSPQSYSLTFSYPPIYLEPAGTVTIPISRAGEGTPGCDPTNNVTTNCNNYVVPGQ
jgi:hypothetical protein